VILLSLLPFCYPSLFPVRANFVLLVIKIFAGVLSPSFNILLAWWFPSLPFLVRIFAYQYYRYSSSDDVIQYAVIDGAINSTSSFSDSPLTARTKALQQGYLFDELLMRRNGGNESIIDDDAEPHV
jgi:hypothetical protein